MNAHYFRAFLVVAASVAASLGFSAHAEFKGWSPDGAYMPVGFTFAMSFPDAETDQEQGFGLGLEWSYAYVFDTTAWAGFFMDAIYDAPNSELRVCVGPELGVAIFGVDAGLVFGSGQGDDDGHVGGQIRGLIGAVAVWFYVRQEFFNRSGLTEVGMLFKYPISFDD